MIGLIMAVERQSEVKCRPRIFYGWRVLSVTIVIGLFATLMSQLFSGVMLPHIEEDTGWSRSSVTFAVTLGSVSAGLTAPFFGRFTDRFGPRFITPLGILVTVGAMCLLGLSASSHIALFYFGHIFGRAWSQNTLAGVVPQTTAVKWFRKMRGRALGLTQMALPLGGAALIPVAQLLINGGVGWQSIYYSFGAFMLVALLTPAALVLRRRPEDLGLLPDGVTSEEIETAADQPKASDATTEVSWTVSQAVHNPALWLLVAAMCIGVAANGAIGFHQFAYFRDQGIASTAAALAVSAYALSGAVANVLWGFLIEKVPGRVVGAGTMLIASVMCAFLLTVDSAGTALLFAVVFGLAARGQSSIILVMEAQYFGRESYGAISGLSLPFQQIGLGLGPALAAISYDATGQSYTFAFVAFGVVYVLAAILIWLARKPELPD